MAPKTLPIILNYNGAVETINCVRSLLRSQPDVSCILVIDNGSTSEDLCFLKEQLEQERLVRILATGKNLGYAGGNNVGIRAAIADGYTACLLVNSDVRFVSPNPISFFDRIAASIGAVGVIGPRIVDEKGKFMHGCCYVNASNGSIVNLDVDTLRPSDFVTGACFYLTRQSIEQVGLLDESFFLYWEETDYCFTVRSRGLKVLYCPFVNVEHHASKAASTVKPYYFNRNRIHFIRKWGRRGKIALALHGIKHALYLTAVIMGGAILKGRANALRRAYLVWKGTFDGLLGKTGVGSI